MSTQPPGQQPWQSGPAPWETSRQPQAGPPPPQQQRPMPPPMPVAPMYQPNPIGRPSIWRIAIGVWLGLILFMITLTILAIGLGSAFESQLRTDFGTSSSSGFGVLGD